MATTPSLATRPRGLPVPGRSAYVVPRPWCAPSPDRLEPMAVASYLSALAETDPWARLQRGVDLLATLVVGCDHASVTTVTGGRLRVRAASDATSRRAADLQDELDEGPGLQAVRTGHSVVAHDLSTETRWPGWCSAAVGELGVRSVLSVLLVPTARSSATLNLCSDTVGGLIGVDLAFLHTLAGPLVSTLRNGSDLDRLGPAA